MMSPNQLLKNFNKISEAPDAVPRLRRFILDLAVRGKLVEQDPNDEPASELLKRIRAKRRHVSHNSNADGYPLEVTEDQPFFEVPSSWEWVLAIELSIVISDKGKKVQTKDVLEFGKFPVVDQGKMFIRGYCNDDQKVIRSDGPIIVFGDHTRETKLIDFDFVVGADGVKLLKPIEVNPSYYFLALQWMPLENRGYGRHFKLLRVSRIPLPPLAEQHRIVAKVDELMALCDELEAAQAKREKRREHLVAATLYGLNNGETNPESNAGPTFAESARFYFNHLPRLTTRPEHIHQLRQTILNLAVRGKLAPQNPRDEPASELIKRIKAEKERMIKERKARKQEPQMELAANEMPFAVPNSWAWARLGDVILLISGQHLQPGEYSDQEQNGPPYITGPADFGVDGLMITRYANIRKAVANKGQILLTVKGAGVGKTAVCNLEEVAISRQLMAMTAIKWSQSFLLLTTHRLAETLKETARSLIPGISREDVGQFVFPLPPLAEQHQIVAKVDELMTLCDELEDRINTTATTRRQLLESTLQEALSA
ncbi:MAG: restriction endonuclease subunit S [Syntrophus sp. (in: bacteria)]